MDWAIEEARWKEFVEKHKIEVGDARAIVTMNGFKALDDYSCTLPSGTVVGKVWKRHEPFSGRGQWWFGQFSHSTEPGMIDIVWRELYVKHPLTGEPERATDDFFDAIAVLEALA